MIENTNTAVNATLTKQEMRELKTALEEREAFWWEILMDENSPETEKENANNHIASVISIDDKLLNNDKKYDGADTMYCLDIFNPDNILYKLEHKEYSVVSRELEWGIGYEDLVSLCRGYIYGSEKLKENILDFLTDINFHIERKELEENTEEFTDKVFKGTWEFQGRRYIWQMNT